MPEDTEVFDITYPCVADDITLTSFATYAADVEAALVEVNAEATKALVRPAAIVDQTAGTAYTAGVSVVPSFNTEILDTDNMFTLAAPTILTVNTAGTYLINFECSTNMISTNTAHRGEILINGSPVASTETGPGGAGQQPPNPIAVSMLVQLAVGNTISVRVTIQGVGNNSTFPRLDATLVSYGGS